MQVAELYSVIKWAEREIGEKNVVGKYRSIAKILNSNSQANQPKQPYEEEREELFANQL